MSKQEFTVSHAYHFDLRSPVRWIISHMWRYKWLVGSYILASIAVNAIYSVTTVLTGVAFTAVLAGSLSQLARVAFTMVGTIVLGGCFDLLARFLPEFTGKKITRDARSEFYLNLLGKSQTFHNRQRVGDLMARATNDMNSAQCHGVSGPRRGL